jgi:hypothetical protein
MNIRAFAGALKYVGEVESKRQTYYIFEGPKAFVLMTFSRSRTNSGNFNVVEKAAVNYIVSQLGGGHAVTSNDLVAKSRKPQYVRDALDALNILYVLVATRAAKIDGRYKGKQLRFNIRSA